VTNVRSGSLLRGQVRYQVRVSAAQAREPPTMTRPQAPAAASPIGPVQVPPPRLTPKAQQAAILATALAGIEPRAWDRLHPRLDNQHHQR